MLGVEGTPWHSKAAALCPAAPPCLPFRLFVCLQGVTRLLSSAALVSPSMERAPLALAAWRCPVLSCASQGLCHLPITLCWGSVGGDSSHAVCLVLTVVTAEERREKMSALMCCRAWPCCGTQHAQEPQKAPCMLLCQAVLMVWGTVTTRIL